MSLISLRNAWARRDLVDSYQHRKSLGRTPNGPAKVKNILVRKDAGHGCGKPKSMGQDLANITGTQSAETE